jgi:predicted phage terminase large subunit-like protein
MTTISFPPFLEPVSGHTGSRVAYRHGKQPQDEAGPQPDALDHRELSLAEFVREAWPVLEGSKTLTAGWYVDAICAHLEAVTDGKIRCLVINLPPRFAKSTIVSVLWPCWVWTFRPERSWLFSSYAAELSERDNRRARSLIRSPWYQTRFGDRFSIPQARGSKDTASRFENSAGGYRIATSVGGAITGEGADVIVVDDPMKADDGNSDQRRATAVRWWSETMASRLNDPRTGARVIVMQRLHEDDLTGYVLRGDSDYVHLCLPMEYEPDFDELGNPRPKPVTPLGWSDPRTQHGELLCPERVGPADVARLKAEVGEYGWAGQYLQRPAPRGGGMFRIDKLQVIDQIPPTAQLIRCRAWDRAGTQGGGAFTAGVKMALDVTTRIVYVEHVARGQWATDQREEETQLRAQADGKYCYILLEQEPGSSGLDSVKATARNLAGYAVHAIRATGNKEVRADPFAAYVAMDGVRLVRGSWNREYLHELENFPSSRYKDQVDSSSLGFNWLTSQMRLQRQSVAAPPSPRFVPR